MTIDTLNRESGYLASPILLYKIDKLHEKNIGQHVPLPQVGTQCPYRTLLPEAHPSISSLL